MIESPSSWCRSRPSTATCKRLVHAQSALVVGRLLAESRADRRRLDTTCGRGGLTPPLPDRGLVSPDEFIPIAEHTGLLRPLTLQVLGAALAECSRWRAAGYDLSVAVNLSARNLLDGALPADVAELLADSG